MKKVLSIICLIVFCISSGILCAKYINKQENNKATQDLQTSYVSENENTNNNDSNNESTDKTASTSTSNNIEQEKPKYSVDFKSLQNVNPEVCGWIIIDDTPINYPILHCQNNEFYLHHNANKDYAVAGSIFMDTRNSIDFTNYNSILYGHNMKDNSMFASIRNYANQNYFNNHKYVYLLTPDKGCETYAIFSAYETYSTSSSYTLTFTSDSFKDFINNSIKQSVINTNYTPGENDNILTLSTCTTGDNRFVIHCAKINK